MSVQYLIAMLITITAIASYINYRYIRLPKSIGLTLFSLLLSLVVMTIISVGGEWLMPIRNLLGGVNFNATVMNGLLSFLLFAGALHINSIELSKHKVTVSVLATVSVFLSCAGVGFALWWIASHFFGLHIDLIYYLLFGALISPTDPIAVLNAMKGTNTPEKVRIKITGESLFNDAVGIVMFVVMLEFIGGKHQDLSLPSTVLLLAQQGLGGLLFGYLLGVFASYFLRRANNDEVAILMTLSLVTAGYSLATLIQVSGPVSMVVAGLVVGNQCRKPTFSQHTVQRLDLFWSLLDDVLNSFLFILIGLEILSLHIRLDSLLLGLPAFVIIVIARAISVAGPMALLEPIREFNWREISIMTWGGMRGGLAIALALSLPEGPEKNAVLSLTYTVVVLSILLQGLTLQPMICSLFPTKEKPVSSSDKQQQADS